jgi:hypothetical protein
VVARRRVRPEALRAAGVAGYILAVVGTLYAVLLGLVVINVQTKYDQARSMAVLEANACSTSTRPTTKNRPASAARFAPFADYVKQAIDETGRRLPGSEQKEGTTTSTGSSGRRSRTTTRTAGARGAPTARCSRRCSSLGRGASQGDRTHGVSPVLWRSSSPENW